MTGEHCDSVYRGVSSLLHVRMDELQVGVQRRLGDGFQILDTFPEPVRVWHLLSHTAGFEDRPVAGAFAKPRQPTQQ